ncbi:hypothetical protein MPSEU_000222600 [Mayamaea pseudoterrestris]|nr:hypothetical protein MPSEU_000222600 [Mayamaea pseudoterrestris]
MKPFVRKWTIASWMGFCIASCSMHVNANKSIGPNDSGRLNLSFEIPFILYLPRWANYMRGHDANDLPTSAKPGNVVWRFPRAILKLSNDDSQEQMLANSTVSIEETSRLGLPIFSNYFQRNPERAAAFEAVQCMLRETHGLWTSLAKYSTPDILKSLYALARLQKAALYHELQQEEQRLQAEKDDKSASSTIEPELLQDLAYYAIFANAAYGWKLDLAWNRRLSLGGDIATILAHTNLSHDDIIAQEWTSKTHRPGYFLARDHVKKSIVLCVRGTWSAHDVLTDLCCLPDEAQVELVRPGIFYSTREKRVIRAHHGMLQAARLLKDAVQELIHEELKANPEYSLVLVGHSMGGGVCALLKLLLQDTVTTATAVYIYGAPCVVSFDDWESIRDANIVSVLMDGDPFSRLSFGHISDIGAAVSNLCADPSLRSRIVATCRGSIANMSDEDLSWCTDTHLGLQKSMANEKLVPPGRILRLSLSGRNQKRVVSLREESPANYLWLHIRPGMFDLQHHVPAKYIWTLQQLANASPMST